MCIVLFAWATNQEFFKDLTDTDFRKKLMEDRDKMINDDVLPFGFIDDGSDIEEIINKGSQEFWNGADFSNKW